MTVKPLLPCAGKACYLYNHKTLKCMSGYATWNGYCSRDDGALLSFDEVRISRKRKKERESKKDQAFNI